MAIRRLSMTPGEALLTEARNSPGRSGEKDENAMQRNLLKQYFDEKELKFRHVSADQFSDVWSRYDKDGE